MDQNAKVNQIGLTIVGIIVAAALVVFMFFMNDMNHSALMGASPLYKPNIPAAPAADITQAQQCNPNYDKNWVGCQRLDQ